MIFQGVEKMTRRIQLTIALALLVVLVFGLFPVSRVQLSQAQGAEVYNLGEVLPYTGDLGEYGKGFKEGIDLAVEQMNAQLAAAGRQLSFKVASQDTAGTPDGALKAIQTVVQTSGAQVVGGPLSTREVLRVKQIRRRHK